MMTSCWPASLFSLSTQIPCSHFNGSSKNRHASVVKWKLQYFITLVTITTHKPSVFKRTVQALIFKLILSRITSVNLVPTQHPIPQIHPPLLTTPIPHSPSPLSVCVCVCACTRACVRVCMRACTSIHVCICASVNGYLMCICVPACV